MFSNNATSNWTSPDQLLQTVMSTDARIEPTMEKSMQQSHQLFSKEAVSQLTSYEQRDLLDAVDKLRRANIPGKDFSVPQVIVCGDQSAGKSSVLEAISQLQFPVGGGRITTKLATEVVLRNNSSPSIAPVTLAIIADKSRTSEQKSHLEKFSFKVNVDDPKAFSNAVNAALEYLTLFEPETKLWYDRLHVEISGPTQPNLTLVDLPGLIQNEADTNRGDKERIKDLVKRYVTEPKAIVLAVVRADNDSANQEITQLVKDYHAVDRTMGILTKADRLASVSEEETAAMNLACNRNTSLSLGLGWHTLINTTHQGAQSVSYEHRDEAERQFFTRLPWSELNRENAGIAALREKLSLILFDLITNDLVHFVGRMEVTLEERRLRHDRLGAARDSPSSQRHHLQRIQRDLQSLIQDALDGRQDRPEFASFFDGSVHKALRTTINQYSVQFAVRMRERGKQYNVFGKSEQRNRHFRDYSPELHGPNFYPPYKPSVVEQDPSNISLGAYCQVLASFIDDTRGTSLQGFQKSGTQMAIFRQQSVHWGTISKEYIETCYTAASDFLRCAMMHVAGRHTGEKLMHHFVHRSFDEIGSKLEQRLKDLLWPYQKSHPSTQNPKYSSRVGPYKKVQRSHNSEESEEDGSNDGEHHVDGCWAEIALKLSYEQNLVFAAEALDSADAYYDLALDTFIDNITILAIEAILLENIKDLLSYDDVAQLEGDRLAEIAAEPPGAQQEREELDNQIAVLVEVISTCKKYKQTGSLHSKFTLPAKEHTAGDAPTTHRSQNSTKSKVSRTVPISEGEVEAVAPEALSTSAFGNSRRNRQDNIFSETPQALGSPAVASRSTSSGAFVTSSIFSPSTSIQSTQSGRPSGRSSLFDSVTQKSPSGFIFGGQSAPEKPFGGFGTRNTTGSG